MNKKIAILGCGWLGLPLAESLIKNGYTINGSTTSKEKLNDLTQIGINAFLITLTEEKLDGDITGFFMDVSIAIINVPPKLRGEHKENYVKKMQLLHNAIVQSSVKKVVFVSSTAVYGEAEGKVTEETLPEPTTESGIQMLKAEAIFKNESRIQTTILRFGGLISADRHPITILSGRKNLSNGGHPINLIHRTDCIKIIEAILKNNWWNELFNGVYPYHPIKKDYYTAEARKRGLQLPDYKLDNSKKGKIVQSNRLIYVKKHLLTTTLT
ncbi:SDR family oxidoreductase [Aurantibacter crassamenti]|uniref:SDR family oxidoreductase n=1 Tax=Aurantibacter crassamenti TaxID=1837375 RepID=UPI0019396E70|nr:SDR family oxidoreductase [Aurantibacter crassamenti]MBM1105497.1 SDR family oxidoreductase [Aurantibacter crassamenti]